MSLWRRFLCLLMGHNWKCFHLLLPKGACGMDAIRFVYENRTVPCGRCGASCPARVEQGRDSLVAVPKHWPEVFDKGTDLGD